MAKRLDEVYTSSGPKKSKGFWGGINSLLDKAGAGKYGDEPDDKASFFSDIKKPAPKPVEPNLGQKDVNKLNLNDYMKAGAAAVVGTVVGGPLVGGMAGGYFLNKSQPKKK
jgi:hypothetical protein